MNYYNENDPFAALWLAHLMDDGHIQHGLIDTRSITEVQGSDVKGFKQCHFFSGIGGWSEALRLAGWPDNVSVWTGSCPCQPFSIAGKGLGDKDERHLWPEFLRLIAECRPPVVFGEQVASADVIGTKLEAAFVIAVQDCDYAKANKLAKRLVANRNFHYSARWVDRVQADLADVGYAFRFKVLGAHSVGSPHIRQRLFWLAESDSSRRPTTMWGQGLYAGNESEQGRCVVADRLGVTNSAGPQSGSGATEAERHGSAPVATGPWHDFQIAHCRDGKARRISAQSSDEPLAHGMPRSMGPLVARLGKLGVDPGVAKRIIRLARANRPGRLRGYGNAIVSQIAAEFVRAFMNIKLKNKTE